MFLICRQQVGVSKLDAHRDAEANAVRVCDGERSVAGGVVAVGAPVCLLVSLRVRSVNIFDRVSVAVV